MDGILHFLEDDKSTRELLKNAIDIFRLVDIVQQSSLETTKSCCYLFRRISDGLL